MDHKDISKHNTLGDGISGDDQRIEKLIWMIMCWRILWTKSLFQVCRILMFLTWIRFETLLFWYSTFLHALAITWKTLRLSFRLWTSWMRLILMPAKTVIHLAIFTKAFALFAECWQLWRVLYSSHNYRNHHWNYNLLIGGKVFVHAVVRRIFGKWNWKYQSTGYSFCWRLKNSWKLDSGQYRECSDYPAISLPKESPI